MKIFAIGDLHLSATGEKPMDVFGPEWAEHDDKIRENWCNTVRDEDVVLVPGDLSWAMRLEEAQPDLEFIDKLPGIKYFIRGNHDYWYSSPTKVRRATGSSMRLIRFDADVHRGVGICGIRGWPWPGLSEYDPEDDERHWEKALHRFRLSLDSLAEQQWDTAIAMFHYPPLTRDESSELCDMARAAGIRRVVYGHLHGEATEKAFEGERDG
ncbi:MAG: metallophosphoesterase, partial [Planctomycetota bacterium]